MSEKDIRESNHWILPYWKQRMTSKQWRKILLEGKDRIIFQGVSTNLIAKNLGSGIVEISKELKKK